MNKQYRGLAAIIAIPVAGLVVGYVGAWASGQMSATLFCNLSVPCIPPAFFPL